MPFAAKFRMRVIQLVLLLLLFVEINDAVIIGIDGQVPATPGNWNRRRYNTLRVEKGVQVSFSWITGYHGVYRAKDEKDWRKCQETDGGEMLQEPSLSGSYTLDTTTLEAGTKLYIFCPVHCDTRSNTQMRVEIDILPIGPCRVTRDSKDCMKKPNCTWLGGKCRPLMISGDSDFASKEIEAKIVDENDERPVVSDVQ